MRNFDDVLSLPALSVFVAVESMQKVVAETDKIQKLEREGMILNFIMGILYMYSGSRS